MDDNQIEYGAYGGIQSEGAIERKLKRQNEKSAVSAPSAVPELALLRENIGRLAAKQAEVEALIQQMNGGGQNGVRVDLPVIALGGRSREESTGGTTAGVDVLVTGSLDGSPASGIAIFRTAPTPA